MGSLAKKKWKFRNILSIHYWGSRISDDTSEGNQCFSKIQCISSEKCWQYYIVWFRWRLQKKKKKSRKCAVCQLNHSIFQHNPIKEEYINPRWEFAKKQELCFRCLGSKLWKSCKNSQICGNDGCTDTHKVLLHI